MCHSRRQKNPWLKMTYSSFHSFTDAIITNRTNCCWNRFKKFDIYVQQSKCFSGDNKGQNSKTKTWPCVGIGNELKLQYTSNENNYLNLLYFAGKGTRLTPINGVSAQYSGHLYHNKMFFSWTKFPGQNPDTDYGRTYRAAVPASNCLTPNGSKCYYEAGKPEWDVSPFRYSQFLEVVYRYVQL